MAEVLGAAGRPTAGPSPAPAATVDVLVVGTGVAGARVCERLRAEGFGGSIALVGAEPDPPYDRPPLTTHPGTDTDLARTMDIDVHALADLVHLGLRALAAEPVHAAPETSAEGAWLVSAVDGSGSPTSMRAAVLVAATGAAPIVVPGWESAALLHTRPQADALWDRIGPGSELVVVGGGWIGCEVAHTAAVRGARVQLLEAGDQLLPARVPAGAARRVADLLAGVGVGLRLGQPVTAVTPGRGGRIEVRTSAGPVVGDVALAALGVRPETAWLPAELTRSINGAVLTDQWGRGSLPGLFALGDAAARWSPRAQRHLPGGHWTEAFHCAESVAPAIAAWVAEPPGAARWAEPLPTVPDDPIPYTFSDLGEHRLLVLGEASGGAREVWREQGAGWTVYVLDDETRLTGVVALDRPRDVVAARKAMRTAALGQPVVDVAALADPTAPPARCFPPLRAAPPVD